MSLRWAEWEPTYERILADFGYDRAADEEARDLLVDLAREKRRPDADELRTRILGNEVVIAGPWPSARGTEAPEARSPEDAPFGPSLLRDSGPLAGRVVIATDAATWAFPRAAAIVTDLDGDVQAQILSGVPLYVHAHGDNVPALRRWVPQMGGPIQPTTQAAPVPGVENFGGFTDGDRAACIAVHHGATALALAGFDWDKPAAKPGRDPDLKRRKLAWARRIVEGLGVPVRYV